VANEGHRMKQRKKQHWTAALAALATPLLVHAVPVATQAGVLVEGFGCPGVGGFSNDVAGGDGIAGASFSRRSPMNCEPAARNRNWTGAGTAGASLPAGTLRAAATATGQGRGDTSFNNYGVLVQSSAQFSDTVYFDGSSDEPGAITLDLDGFAISSGTSYLSASLCLYVRNEGSPWKSNCRVLQNGYAPIDVEIDWQLSEAILVSPRPMHIWAALTVVANDGGGGQATIDLSHTAHLGIALPEGVSFRSASGLLLTAADSPGGTVPVPDTLALAGLGLFALSTFGRRVRAAAGHRA
jgi:hypothetical protein